MTKRQQWVTLIVVMGFLALLVSYGVIRVVNHAEYVTRQDVEGQVIAVKYEPSRIGYPVFYRSERWELSVRLSSGLVVQVTSVREHETGEVITLEYVGYSASSI